MISKKLKYILPTAAILAGMCLIIIYVQYFGLNIQPKGGKATIYIPEEASYEQAIDSIEANLIIKNKKMFLWVAEKKKYQKLVKPGKYVIDKPLSYNELINILRGGKQTPIKITFSNVRTLNELAGRIGGQIEADSAEIMDFFTDPGNYSDDGFKSENVISVFIPDTYEFYWNTRAGKLYNRMLREYRKFWNRDRLKKSEEIGLSQIEVSTLASIVDEEVLKSDEKPRIAGVYLNRLKRGIPLQADPTIKFAINNFTVNRILFKHLETESPYNTYKHAGLPPGPIGCPSINGIDAVLNAEKHDYIYFAAKSDFSGYHNFSRTLSEHNRYANQYQRELNKRRIYR
jgi:UPF0755 protein